MVAELYVARGFLHGQSFWRLVVGWMIERILLHVHHLFDALVVRFELFVSNGPQIVTTVWSILLEPARIFAQMYVGVDQ